MLVSRNKNLPDFDVESKPGHQSFEYHSRLTWGTKNFISIFSLVRPSPSRRLSLIFQFSSLAKNEMFYLISSQDFSFQFHNDSICFDFSVVELSTVQTWLWLFTFVSISFLVSCCFHHAYTEISKGKINAWLQTCKDLQTLLSFVSLLLILWHQCIS